MAVSSNLEPPAGFSLLFPCAPAPATATSFQLRPYQSKAIADLRAAYAAKSKRALFVLGTGGGKTAIFTHIAERSAAKGKRVMILAHRKELVSQASARLTLSGTPHGVVAPWAPSRASAAIQVASVQTLVRRLEDTPAPDLIIVDEAHHAVAGSWQKIIAAYPDALVLGVTATPCRLDGRGLGDAFDVMIQGPSVAELIALGFLVPSAVYAPSFPDLTGVRTRAGDYASEDLEKALERSSITGDAVKSYSELAAGMTAVAFCASVKHARATAAAFSAAGIPADYLTGDHSAEDRKRILDDLEAGLLKVVAAVDVISEGTDIPAIGCAILLRPTKSLSLFLQQVGRALRPMPGKVEAIILDHAGNALRHGLPEEDRVWTLDTTKKRKPRVVCEDADDVKIRQCTECYLVHEPAPECPGCGHVYPVKSKEPSAKEGEIARLTAEMRERLKKMRRKSEADCRTLGDWQALALERGHSEGWAFIRHKIRSGKR